MRVNLKKSCSSTLPFRNCAVVRGWLIKVLWHDGIGLCLLTTRLERGQFIWPSATATGAIALSEAQLATLLEGCEWRAPVHGRRPELAGKKRRRCGSKH